MARCSYRDHRMSESTQAPSGTDVDSRTASTLAGLLGLVFLALYWWLEKQLPRGPQEFAYFPYMTDPLPFAPMRGFTFEQLFRHFGRTFVLGPGLLCLSFAVAGWWRVSLPGPRVRRTLLIAVVGVSVVVTAVVMGVVLQGRAIVDDELVYRQQAELLASGRLAEITVPPWGWEVFTMWTRLGATGKYLPGEPLIQIPGTVIGLPALLHLLLAPLALWGWYRLVRGDAGANVALWATVLVGVSPMFMLTNALALSHTTTLTCLIFAALGHQMAAGDRPVRGAILAGMTLGFGLMVRPQVVVPIGLVIGLATLYRLLRRRHSLAVAALIGSGSLWLAVIAAYNWALSGKPWTLPWYMFKPTERFGFGHVGGIEFEHSPWTALENLAVVAVRFNGWWLGWPLSLGLVLAWLVLGRPRQGAQLWLLGATALILMNLPYYSTGISDTGPIYYFELLLPAALLGAHAIVRAGTRWPTVTGAVLIVHFALGTTSFLGENVARLDRLVTTIHTSTEEVLAKLEPPALLIHENHWTESTRHGWVWSFPVRYRNEGDPIVTYPRGPGKYVLGLIKRYDYRQCWYYRTNPATSQQELYRCQDAMNLLLDPRQEGSTLRITPTAERLGLIRPEDTFHMKRLKRLSRKGYSFQEKPAPEASGDGAEPEG